MGGRGWVGGGGGGGGVDAGFAALGGGDGGGGAGEGVEAGGRLGEGDHIADAGRAGEQEAELGAGLLSGQADHVEHRLLRRGGVDTDRAATDLVAVAHDVVRVGQR